MIGSIDYEQHEVFITKSTKRVAKWIPPLIITRKYPGSNPDVARFFFAIFEFNMTWSTWRHCKVPQVSNGLRKYLTGYASSQWVKQLPNGLRNPWFSLPFSNHRSAEHNRH